VRLPWHGALEGLLERLDKATFPLYKKKSFPLTFFLPFSQVPSTQVTPTERDIDESKKVEKEKEKAEVMETPEPVFKAGEDSVLITPTPKTISAPNKGEMTFEQRRHNIACVIGWSTVPVLFSQKL